MCLCEKTGSTAWKLLFLRALGEQGHLEEPFRLSTSPHKALVKQRSRAERAQELLADPRVPRIMLVRDPFARLLSGFLDKASTSRRWLESRLPMPCRSNGGGCYSPGQPFSSFVQAATQSERINAHFQLLSKHCLIDRGLSYDYYLKVEQIDQWYAPLVAALQLRAVTAKGWHRATKFWPGQHDCFYIHASPPKSNCESTNEAILMAAAAAAATTNSNNHHNYNYNASRRSGGLAGTEASTTWSTAQTKSGRNQHADAKLTAYYTTREAKAVALWAQEDLDLFGYEAWLPKDGPHSPSSSGGQAPFESRRAPSPQAQQQQGKPAWKSWQQKQRSQKAT